MSSLKLSGFLFTLAFTCVVDSVVGVDPLLHICSTSSGNFSPYDPYKANLNKLMASLSYQTPSNGFGSGSVGQKPNQAYGLALCRGDVSSSNCKTCVADASSEVRKLCPSNKGAIIWYDDCLVKYSDVKFFGQIDNQYMTAMWNVNEVNNSATFNQKTNELLSGLAKEASGTPKLYAAGDMVLDEKTKLYGLTQCTRDLSKAKCNKCLEGIIGYLPTCCDAKEGGRVLSGSCNFRYEISPFVTA